MSAFAQRNLPYPDRPLPPHLPPNGKTSPGIVTAPHLHLVTPRCDARDVHAPARRYGVLAPEIASPSSKPIPFPLVLQLAEDALLARTAPPAPPAPVEQLALTPEMAPEPKPAEQVAAGFPIKLGNHIITSGYITVMHSAMEKSLKVGVGMSGRAGKQTNSYTVRARRQGDERIILDNGSATVSIIKLDEWQAFVDHLEVSVSFTSRNTVPFTPALVKMARDVIAYRRKEPTDVEWKAEQTAAATSQPEPAPEAPPVLAVSPTQVQIRKLGKLVDVTFVRWGEDTLVYRDDDTEFSITRSILLDRIARGQMVVSGEMPDWAKVEPDAPTSAPEPKPGRTQLKVQTARGLLDCEFIAWTNGPNPGLRYNDGKWPCFVPAEQLRRKLRLGQIEISGYRPEWANVPTEEWSEKPDEKPEPSARTRVTMKVGQRQVELKFVEWTDSALVIINNLGRRQMLKRDVLVGDLITGKYTIHGDKPVWAQTPWERKPEAQPITKEAQTRRKWGYAYGLVIKGEIHPWKYIRRKCVCAACTTTPRSEMGSEPVPGEPGSYYYECSGPQRHPIKSERDLKWAHGFLPVNSGAEGKTYDADKVLEAYPDLQAQPDDPPF